MTLCTEAHPASATATFITKDYYLFEGGKHFSLAILQFIQIILVVIVVIASVSGVCRYHNGCYF